MSETSNSGYFLITPGRKVLQTPTLQRNSIFLFKVLLMLEAKISGQRASILPIVSLSKSIFSNNKTICRQQRARDLNINFLNIIFYNKTVHGEALYRLNSLNIFLKRLVVTNNYPNF